MEKPNGTEKVFKGLESAKNVDWCEPFDEENLSYPFFSDKDDDITYTANAMYKRFSYITRHGQTVMFMGDQPTWYEWIGQIVGPHDNEKRRKALKDCIIDRPVSENGYIWSWAYAPHWPTATMNDLTGREEHYHYDQMFRFINGVYEVIAWDGNTDILSKKGRKTVTYKRGRYGKKWRYHDIECNHEGEDVSKGKTVREKLDMAVRYILEDMHGAGGLTILDENLNNGENLGRIGDASSNYWDNFLFGYKDAYENICEIAGRRDS